MRRRRSPRATRGCPRTADSASRRRRAPPWPPRARWPACRNRARRAGGGRSTSLAPPVPGRGPSPRTRSRCRWCPSGPRCAWSETSVLRQHLAKREPHVGRPLGESTHVPRIPVLAVRDECLDAIAGSCQAVLLGGADAVEHLDLEAVTTDAGRADLLGDLLDEPDVVRAEAEPDRPVAAVEQEGDGQPDITRIDAAAAPEGDRFLLVVGALHQ